MMTIIYVDVRCVLRVVYSRQEACEQMWTNFLWVVWLRWQIYTNVLNWIELNGL